MSAIAPVSVPVPEPGSPSPEEVLQQLEALLASPQLRESHQLQAFLDFIVRESLAGRQDGLKEYTVGCRVFGRREDYDPRHDGIVRVQATTLRKRLDKFYTEEGAHHLVIIELPRGGYVPAFRYNQTGSTAVIDAALAPETPAPTWRTLALALIAGMAVMALAWFLWSSAHPAPIPAYRMTTARPSDFPQLWSAFFEPGASNLVAFGVPLFYSAGGLYLRDVKVNSGDQEREGRIEEFAEKFKVRPTPTDDTYTGVGEMVGTNLLSSFFTASGVPVRVTNARTIGESDLAGQNLVVVSSMRFQTLLAAMHLPSAFEFLGITPETILNPKPFAGEKTEYVFASGAGISTSYALISLWPSVTKGKRILWIGGVHTWATQAATEFVLQPDQLRKVAREFESDRTTGAHGKPSPYFQILVRVEGRENHSQKVEYVTHHYLPAE